MVAWRAYIETSAELTNTLERDLTEAGVTLGDYQVLVYLSEAPGQAMRMCDLAENLQLSPSGLTRRFDGLVRSGHVAREGSRDDRRVMMGVITESGLALLEQTAPLHLDSVRRRIFDHLDSTQVDMLASIFIAINEGLRAAEQGGDRSRPARTAAVA